MPDRSFSQLAELDVDPDSALVFEMGWQSWSPSSAYPVTETSARPVNAYFQRLGYRPETAPPPEGFQGEGLLAVQCSLAGDTHVFGTPDGRTSVPSIRAELIGDTVMVSANGPVTHTIHPATALHPALASWADGYAVDHQLRTPRGVPAMWASWYQYFTEFCEADLIENLDAMDRLELPIGIVRLDDAFQSGIGDWLQASSRFSSVEKMIGLVLDRRRSAGVWSAPFLLGADSRTFAEHPDWVVREADGTPTVALHNWNQLCYALDTTHPGAQEYLAEVFSTYREWGAEYFMTDFLYAGALPGRRRLDVDALTAYATGMATIREAAGDAWIQGCGAPMLPSAGFVDTMRVGADIAPHYAAAFDDVSCPGMESAAISTIGRAFTHGRLWTSDPDCFSVRPEVEGREEWAAIVAAYGGSRISSDRLNALDDWGLQRTRDLLKPSSEVVIGTDLPLCSDATARSLAAHSRPGRTAGDEFLQYMRAAR